jgi:hypothetical protein
MSFMALLVVAPAKETSCAREPTIFKTTDHKIAGRVASAQVLPRVLDGRSLMFFRRIGKRSRVVAQHLQAKMPPCLGVIGGEKADFHDEELSQNKCLPTLAIKKAGLLQPGLVHLQPVRART